MRTNSVVAITWKPLPDGRFERVQLVRAVASEIQGTFRIAISSIQGDKEVGQRLVWEPVKIVRTDEFRDGASFTPEALEEITKSWGNYRPVQLR